MRVVTIVVMLVVIVAGLVLVVVPVVVMVMKVMVVVRMITRMCLHNSVTEHLPNMHKALWSNPSNKTTNGIMITYKEN